MLNAAIKPILVISHGRGFSEVRPSWIFTLLNFIQRYSVDTLNLKFLYVYLVPSASVLRFDPALSRREGGCALMGFILNGMPS